MLNEPVHIAEYSEHWPILFRSERDRLVDTLREVAERIAHIGSTAVPELAAKPIIDIMLGVDTYPPNENVIEQVSALGYESLGEAGVSGRLYFRRRGEIAFNLHVVQHQGQHWISNIALRDYLRANRSARDRYAAAKRAAIPSGATDLLSYSEQKTSTVAQMLSESVAYRADKMKQPIR